MITLILSALVGVGFTLMAVQNVEEVSVNVLNNTYNLPLFVLITAVFMAGVIITSIFSFFDSAMASVDIKNKEKNYKNTLKVNSQLNNEIKKLKAENNKLNERLQKTIEAYYADVNLKAKEIVKAFFYKITHPTQNSQKDWS